MSFSHFDRGDIYRLLHLNTIPEKTHLFLHRGYSVSFIAEYDFIFFFNSVLQTIIILLLFAVQARRKAPFSLGLKIFKTICLIALKILWIFFPL